MPWTDSNYPDSLKNFMAPVRRKAVDIANALLKDGYEEGRAISIATSQAEEWATNRNMQVRKKRATGTLTAGNGNGSAKSGTKSKAASSTKKSSDSKKTASSKAGDGDSKKSASDKSDSGKSGGKKKSSKKPKTLTTPKFPH